MDTNQEKLHRQAMALLKQKQEENDALRKIITAMKSKEIKTAKGTKSCK